MSRDYKSVIALGLKVVEENPDFAFPHLLLGQAFFFSGDKNRGIRECDMGYELEPHPCFLAWKVYMMAASGDRQAARRILRVIRALAESSYVEPYYLATAYAGLGEKDMAFEWLEKAFEARDEMVTNLQVDPAMDSLRSDPRFARLLGQVGFNR